MTHTPPTLPFNLQVKCSMDKQNEPNNLFYNKNSKQCIYIKRSAIEFWIIYSMIQIKFRSRFTAIVKPLSVLHGEDPLLGTILRSMSSVPVRSANGTGVPSQDGASQLPLIVLEVV